MKMIHTRVVLAVRDLKASTRFYEDVLGCRLYFGGDAATGWSFLARDQFNVMLGECPDVTPASDIGDHSYVAYVTVDDIDGLHADIVSRGGGALASAPETKPWGMREFGVRTPDGHRIMFGQEVG